MEVDLDGLRSFFENSFEVQILNSLWFQHIFFLENSMFWVLTMELFREPEWRNPESVVTKSICKLHDWRSIVSEPRNFMQLDKY